MKKLILLLLLMVGIPAVVNCQNTPPVTIVTIDDFPSRNLTLADLNNDGLPDIIAIQDELSVVETGTNLVQYRNLGGGQFAASELVSFYDIPTNREYNFRATDVADVDGDGDLDILSVSRDFVYWHENTGSSDWPIYFIGNVDGGEDIVAHDVDEDGDKDVIVNSYNTSEVRWYENTYSNFGTLENWTFFIVSSTIPEPVDLAMIDFTGDNQQDLLITGVSSEVPSNNVTYLAEYLGPGNFADPELIITDTGAEDIVVADFDKDGDDDFVGTFPNLGYLTKIENNGLSSPIGFVFLNLNSEEQRVAAADLNGDRYPDVLGIAASSQGLSAYMNEGGNGFTPGQLLTSRGIDGASLRDVQTADLDNDGDVDIVASSSTLNRSSGNTGGIKLLLNDRNIAPPPVSDPVISSFSPTSGAPGDRVTINGSNFGNDPGAVTVEIGGDIASLETVSDTRIVAVVPDFAETGEILVSVNGNGTVAPGIFTVEVDPVNEAIQYVTNFPDRVDANTSTEVSVRITAGQLEEANFFYAPMRDVGNAIPKPVQRNGNQLRVTLNAGDFDELGIRYLFELIGSSGDTVITPVKFTHLTYPSSESLTVTTASPAGSGGTPDDYNLVAFPFERQRLSLAFSELGPANPELWRMFSYSGNGSSPETYYNELNSTSFLQPGNGYWLIYKDDLTLRAGGQVVPVTFDVYPTITILPGEWEMIGNPYPFTLDWDNVLAFSGLQGSGVRLITFNGSSAATAGELAAFEGGFVFNGSDESITLEFPFYDFCSLDGNCRLASLPARENWELPLRLTQGNWSSNVAGIGMHEGAAQGVDAFDLPVLPGLFRTPKLQTLDGNQLHRSIVSPASQQRWQYQVDSGNDPLTISWDADYLKSRNIRLTLVNPYTGKRINMQDQNRFTVSGKARLVFHYGDVAGMAGPDEAVSIGKAFPNPTASGFDVPVSLNNDLAYQAQIAVYNAVGHQVHVTEPVQIGGNTQKISWRSDQQLPPGLYFYQVQLSEQDSGNIIKTYTHRILFN